MQGPVYFLGYIMEGSVTHTFLAKAWVSMCVDHYEFKPLICKKLLEKKMHTYYPWSGLFIRNLNDLRVSLWKETPYIWEDYKEKKCKWTNNMLENGLIYLY